MTRKIFNIGNFHRLSIGALLTTIVAGIFLYIDHVRYQAMHAIPPGLYRFKLSDPLPVCDRWKEHMPATRDPDVYRLYINARKLWRSKIAWQLTRTEALRILTDVNLASQKGDWGARALMGYFYRHGLGPLPSNHVLDPDADKTVEMARLAAAAGQPWGLYDLGVAHEHGYGGAHYDKDIAWAYYLKAAQLGSPEAQMALADAYSSAGRFDAEEKMLQCAYQQRHGAAAFALGVDRRASKKDFKEAIMYFHDGVKFGDKDCSDALTQLFDEGYWITTQEEEKATIKTLGITADLERSTRYKIISDALAINPDLKLSRLDQILPLPPTKLPKWNGIDDALEPEPDKPTY